MYKSTNLTIGKTGKSSTGRTNLYVVTSALNNIPLGNISWFSNWRKYVFWPETGTLFDPSCLREIADFVELETKKHKEHKNGI